MGLFHNKTGGLFGGYSGGLFGSGGAAAYFGSHMIGAPSQKSSRFILGGYAGAGANLFITNAGGAKQLEGPFTTASFNVVLLLQTLGSSFLSVGECGSLESLLPSPALA